MEAPKYIINIITSAEEMVYFLFNFFCENLAVYYMTPTYRYPSWRTLAAGKCCEINEIESSVPVSVIICDLPSCHRQILQISQILCLCRGGAHND